MSASKTCGAFALANGIGQMFCLQAAANCSIKRFACTFAAGASNKNLKKMTKRLESLKKNQTILSNGGTSLIDQIINQIEVESKNAVSPIISSCNSHDKSIQDLIVTAAGMANAMKQGKDCQNKLSSMSSTNNTGKIVSMEEMCAQPANASSTICKCRTDNTAKGCPGYIAGNANEGNINKDLNTKGTSNMAGLSYKPKNIPTSGVDLDKNLDDLSDEAKKALAAGGDQKQESGSMFGVAGAANAGGGASTSSAAAAGAGSEKGKLADEPKSIGSSFMNAIGSLVGKDRSGGKPSAAKDDKFASDKYKEQIKRQIASEQMRNEVSSASGISNWDKIRTRYNHNKDSFIGD